MTRKSQLKTLLLVNLPLTLPGLFRTKDFGKIDLFIYNRRYDADQLFGGHVIMLDKHSEAEALAALSAFPKGLQIGGEETLMNSLSIPLMWSIF